MNPESAKILEIAKDSFYTYMYPAIVQQFPEIKDKFMVNITSSVAYGTADKFSDLDMFLIFYNQRDYVKYASKLDKFIKNLHFPNHEYAFDKGIRLELESLARSDVDNVVKNPHNKNNWYNLSDWLMFWFINSVTLYDPKNLLSDFKNKWNFYPQDIADVKLYSLKLKLNKNFYLARKSYAELESFIQFNKFVSYINAFMDINFLTRKSFVPHLKWKETLFMKQADKSSVDILTGMINHFFSTSTISPTYSVLNIQDIDCTASRICFPTYQMLATYYKENTKIESMCYLPDESGVFFAHKSHRTYNIDNRISHIYKYYEDTTPSAKTVMYKQALYYNFIIWRYIRVIDKSIKRNQKFTYMLYISITINNILRCLGMIADIKLPSVERLSFDTLNQILSPLPCEVRTKLLKFLTSDDFNNTIIKSPQHVISLLWESYYQIQTLLKNKYNIPTTAVKDPLSTQFKIEYWKYENLFL